MPLTRVVTRIPARDAATLRRLAREAESSVMDYVRRVVVEHVATERETRSLVAADEKRERMKGGSE